MSTQIMQERIADYFKTQPVLKAWLFGSYSRGEQKPWSDVDILVELDRDHPIGLLKYAGIICDLEDITGHKIDLVEEGTLKPFAVESVNRDKRLIYERTEESVREEMKKILLATTERRAANNKRGEVRRIP